MVLSKGGIQTLSFVSTLFVARLLDPSDYGLMALAGVWISIISMMAELGLGNAIIQFRDANEKELNACFWLAISLAILGYVAIFLAAPFIGEWFHSPKLPLVLQVSSLSIPLIAIRTVPDSLLRKNLALDKISQAEILANVVSIPLMLMLAWAGKGVWALVIGTITSPLVQSMATFYFHRWTPGFSIKGERLISMLSFSVSTIGSRLCWATYSQADTFILGKVGGDAVVGLFSMGKQIATLPVSKISTVVNQLATPVMAELQSNQTALRNAFIKGVRIVSCVTFPLCIGMMIVAEDLVRVGLTDKWITIVPVLQAFCVYAVIRSLDVLFPPILLAKYRTWFLLWYGVALVLIMPAAFFPGEVSAGSLGVVFVWLSVYPIIASRMIHEVLRELDLRWIDLWSEIEGAVWLTGFMAGTVYVLQLWVSTNQAISPLLRLLMVSGFGAVVYTVGIYWRGGQAKQDLLLVLTWATRSRPSV